MNHLELQEMVNPVFNTAKSCVQLNAAAGDKDAQHLLDALSVPKIFFRRVGFVRRKMADQDEDQVGERGTHTKLKTGRVGSAFLPGTFDLFQCSFMPG